MCWRVPVPFHRGHSAVFHHFGPPMDLTRRPIGIKAHPQSFSSAPTHMVPGEGYVLTALWGGGGSLLRACVRVCAGMCVGASVPTPYLPRRR